MPPQQHCPVILLVDDVESNLIALTALLAGDGVEVISARSGLEALEILLVRDVAVALVDVQMPEMDGFELAELMRGTERTRLVPIIFITGGSPDEQRRFRGYDMGAVDYLYKPVEPGILRNKTQVFLDLWSQRQRIAETLRLNEMFTAVLSHDLRNPLSVIGNGAALLEAHPSAETARLVGGRIRQTALRMTHMINDLLDLTRARLSHGIPVQRERVDLGLLAEAVCEEQRLLAPQSQVLLVREGVLAGSWDATRVGQALANLLANASTHGAHGCPIRVLLDGRKPALVRVEIHNEGVIEPELLPHVFEPFRRGRSQEGLGLGLFIVHEIARAHGGEVRARSSVESGTSFELLLPREL